MFPSFLSSHFSQRSISSYLVQNFGLHILQKQGLYCNLFLFSNVKCSIQFLCLQDDQNANDQSIGIIKEAKEWAGELLSGQTKVIVSCIQLGFI